MLIGINYAQIITSVQTNKVIYGYGEVIKVSFSITNTTDSTVSIGQIKECPPTIILNDYRFEVGCVHIDWTLYLPSKMKATWNWTIEPSRLGMPNIDGVQKIRCSYGIVKDSVYFYAPKYRGGNIYIWFRDEIPKVEYVKLMDSLSATLSYRTHDPTSAFQFWYIKNKSIDSIVTKYKSDSRIKSISDVRELFHDGSVFTSINKEEILPIVFSLSQNYPNPFNPTTTISYTIPKSSHVTLKVYDLLGREIATLVDEYKIAGSYNSKFSISNSVLPSGIYIYRLLAGRISISNKMVLLK